jgi:hypothetical protein
VSLILGAWQSRFKPGFFFEGREKAALAAILVLFVFSACNNKVQDVNIVSGGKASISSVSLSKPYLTVIFEAPENMTSYAVYLQLKGAKPVINVGYGSAYTDNYTSGRDEYTTYTVNKYTIRTDISSYFVSGKLVSGTYRVGVKADIVDSSVDEKNLLAYPKNCVNSH